MFRFTTPTGRFEVNREICLSISGHHEETWMPAWGIRTALVALRSFMDTDAKGQVGGIDCEDGARRKMAEQSGAVKCATCGKTNAEIMREKDEAIQAMGEREKKEDDEVPDELRLAYRDELQKSPEAPPTQSTQQPPRNSTTESQTARRIPTPSSPSAPVSPQSPTSAAPTTATAPQPPHTQLAQRQLRRNDGVPEWIDKAIWGVCLSLVFMVLKRYIAC